MLQAAYSQVETHIEPLVPDQSLPFTVAAGARSLVSASLTIPDRELWLVQSVGARIRVTNQLLVATASQIAIVGGGGSRFAFLPGPLSNMASILFWVTSANLASVELMPGTQVIVAFDLLNNDGVNARQVDLFQGSVVVRRILLVSDLAVARLVQQNSDQGLAERLRAVRG